jgi:hypothetical protein
MSGGMVGQKVLSKPSADSFAVGRRQKDKSELGASYFVRWNRLGLYLPGH